LTGIRVQAEAVPKLHGGHDTYVGFGRDAEDQNCPLLARQQALVRVLLRRHVGGAPLSVVKQYIEQQNRPV